MNLSVSTLILHSRRTGSDEWCFFQLLFVEIRRWQRAATTLESNNSHCPSLAGDSFSGTTAIGASSPTASGVIPLLGPSIEITAAPSLELRALSLHYRTTTIHDSDVLIACICALVEGGRGLGTISQEGGELSIKRFSLQRSFCVSTFDHSIFSLSLSLSSVDIAIRKSGNELEGFTIRPREPV